MSIESLAITSTIVASLATAISGVATCVYVFLTWKLVKETRKMREIQTQPELIMTLEVGGVAFTSVRLNIAVQNVGLGLAKNISFKINHNLQAPYVHFVNAVSELGFIKRGLRYIAPRQKLVFLVREVTSELYDGTFFDIEVTYFDSFDKRHIRIYPMDLIQFSYLAIEAQKPPIDRIAESLNSIKSDVSRLLNRIN